MQMLERSYLVLEWILFHCLHRFSNVIIKMWENVNSTFIHAFHQNQRNLKSHISVYQYILKQYCILCCSLQSCSRRQNTRTPTSQVRWMCLLCYSANRTEKQAIQSPLPTTQDLTVNRQLFTYLLVVFS